MNPTRSHPADLRPTSPTALVIEPVLPHLLAVLSTLSSLGFDTTVAETYQDAKTALAANPPTLLVAGLKLREYNGLQLVLRATGVSPGLPAILTAETPDPVLEGETERLGATFVVMPTSDDELEAAVCRTVLSTRPPGSSDAPPIRRPFERRAASRAAAGPDVLAERRRNVIEALRNAAGADRKGA